MLTNTYCIDRSGFFQAKVSRGTICTITSAIESCPYQQTPFKLDSGREMAHCSYERDSKPIIVPPPQKNPVITIPSWMRESIEWVYDLHHSPSDIAYFLDVKPSVVSEVWSVRTDRIKRKKFVFKDSNNRRLSYSGVSQVYECDDKGTSDERIIGLTNSSLDLLTQARNERDEVGEGIMLLLDILFPDETIVHPYRSRIL